MCIARPGAQRRLNSARIGAPPVNHHNPAPDLPPRAAKHPSDSRSPAVSTPQLGYAQLSCQGEAIRADSIAFVAAAGDSAARIAPIVAMPAGGLALASNSRTRSGVMPPSAKTGIG